MSVRKYFPYGMVIPGLLFAGFVILYPLVELIILSVHNTTRFGSLRGFVGIANFITVFNDPLFLGALGRTLVWVIVVVFGTVLLSMPLALILREQFYGREVARVLIMLPWAISLAMMGIIWRWVLNGEYGLMNHLLRQLGLMEDPIFWLGSADTAFTWQIIIGIIVSMPFTVAIFLGGLASIPTDIYEAARVEGASYLQRFATLTLPIMRPFLNMAIVLNMIYVFNSFPIIWVTTQGGPANGTDILVTYLYKLAFRFGRLDDAAALSLIMFFILMVFIFIYMRLLRRNADEAL